jgi:hypothetical protein
MWYNMVWYTIKWHDIIQYKMTFYIIQYDIFIWYNIENNYDMMWYNIT